MFINDIPVEILQNVFELVVGKPSRSPSKIAGTTSLQILCSVCRAWRDVALQDTLLWGSVHFVPTEGGIRHCERLLQLSAGAPLDIYLNTLSSSIDENAATKAYGKRYLELVAAAAHRWRKVEINIPALALDLQPLWKGETPMLEKLVITLKSPWHSSDPFNTTVLPSYSNLTSLTIAKFSLRWDQWSCASITHLSLGPFDSVCRGPTTGELCVILQTLSDTLSSFTMKGLWHASDDVKVMPTPIILKYLKYLNISLQWTLHVQQVFSSCSFPALEDVELHLALLQPLPPNFTSLLCEEPQLLRSTKRVTFGFVGPASSSLVAALQCAFPQVEHIQLVPYTTLDTSIMAFLSTSRDTLTHLVLAEASLPEVKTLLSTRFQNHATPLQEVKLLVASGTLYRVDYEWIRSHVGQFIISEVRVEAISYLISRVRCPFEERLLVANAPAQRPPPKPKQVRAL